MTVNAADLVHAARDLADAMPAETLRLLILYDQASEAQREGVRTALRLKSREARYRGAPP